MHLRALVGLLATLALGLTVGSLQPTSAHAGEPGDAKAKGRPPLDESGASKNGSRKGGLTWSSGKAGRSLSARPGPWSSALKRSSAPTSSRLVPRRKDSTSAPNGFYEYTPPGYPGEARWPLLISLHGIGENGDGNAKLKVIAEHGIPRVIAEDRWHQDRPLVVLAPQHTSWGCHRPAAVKKFISWALANYPIDPRYVYLAGSSCGATSIWDYLAEHLDTQIAAAVIIAGKGRPAWEKQGCKLGGVALWAFHGHLDKVVDPAGTNVPMDGLSRCKNQPRGYRKTLYPERGHDVWFRTFGDMSGHDIYDWMLSYRRD